MRTKTKIAIAFVVATFAFQAWAFTQVPEARIYSAEPAIPDTRADGYTPEQMRDVLVQIGPEGRALYLTAQNKIDWVMPALGIGMFGMVLWALAEGLVIRGKPVSSRAALLFASFSAPIGLFDYAENVLVGRAMRAGPDAFDRASIEVASVCTQLKFALVGVCVVIIIVLAVARWRQSRGSASSVQQPGLA
jgi:hypothetical protein